MTTTLRRRNDRITIVKYTHANLIVAGQKDLGLAEVSGRVSDKRILAMLTRHNPWVKDDQTPWCAAWMAEICWQCGFDYSRTLRARHFLRVGFGMRVPERLYDQYHDYIEDCAVNGRGVIAVITRGGRNEPGADVLDHRGHVGIYLGMTEHHVFLLGGNQGNKVSVRPYSRSRLLGLRYPTLARQEHTRESLLRPRPEWHGPA